MTNEAGHIVVYDGSCGICEWLKNWAAKNIRDGEGLVFIPYQSPGLGAVAPDVSLEIARERLVFREQDGTILAGAAGVAQTMIQMKDPWHQVGLILAVPGVAKLAEPLYRLIAKNRSKLSQLFGLTACPFPSGDS